MREQHLVLVETFQQDLELKIEAKGFLPWTHSTDGTGLTALFRLFIHLRSSVTFTTMM